MNTVESGLEGQEGGDESQVDTTSTDEATSSISPDLSATQLDALTPVIEGLVQKHTDRQYSSLKKDVDALGQIDRYQQLTSGEGLTHDAAKQRIEFEEDIKWLKRQRGEPVGSEPTEALVPERASSVNYNEAYKNVGVEPPDTEEDIAWALRFQAQDDLENALWKTKREAALSTKPASAGTAIPPAGGKSPTPPDVDDIIEELAELQKSDSDIARQNELEKLLRDKGLWG